QGEKPESRQQLPENKLAGAFFHHGILPEKIWVGLGEVLHQLIDGVVSVLQVEGYAPLQGAVEPQGNQGIGLCRRVVAELVEIRRGAAFLDITAVGQMAGKEFVDDGGQGIDIPLDARIAAGEVE